MAIVRGGHLAALETTESLLERRRKRVTLVFAAPVDVVGVRRAPRRHRRPQPTRTTVWMSVGDGIDAIIKLAARYTLLDMSVEHPSLDEVFLGYYEPQQPAASAGPAGVRP